MSDGRSDAESFVAVGKVLKPRGLVGEAFLLSLTDFPERLLDLETVRLELPDGSHTWFDVDRVGTSGSRLIIKFRGVDTPEAVVRFRDSYLQVSRSAVYALPEDTFYVFEVVGLPVETADGQVLGCVAEVLSYPANDVYVVDRDGKELLLPAVEAWIRVDREAGKVVVKDLEGLGIEA